MNRICLRSIIHRRTVSVNNFHDLTEKSQKNKNRKIKNTEFKGLVEAMNRHFRFDAEDEAKARTHKIMWVTLGTVVIYLFAVNYHQRLLSLPRQIQRRINSSGGYNEYSDLFISPSDKYGVTAIVSDSPVSCNDIVLSIGVPESGEWNMSGGQSRFNSAFRSTHRILRVVATEGDIIKYNGIEIKIRKDHCWLESDFDFVPRSSQERFGAGYFWERLTAAHRASYNDDETNFNHRMRSSRDFGQVHTKLVHKVDGFYKTVSADGDILSYEELMSDFGHNNDIHSFFNKFKSETNSKYKVEIDRQYRFKARPVPVKAEFDIVKTLGTDLEEIDEPSFKDSILKVNMQPTKNSFLPS